MDEYVDMGYDRVEFMAAVWIFDCLYQGKVHWMVVESQWCTGGNTVRTQISSSYEACMSLPDLTCTRR